MGQSNLELAYQGFLATNSAKADRSEVKVVDKLRVCFSAQQKREALGVSRQPIGTYWEVKAGVSAATWVC